jgi:hypothetical protein
MARQGDFFGGDALNPREFGDYFLQPRIWKTGKAFRLDEPRVLERLISFVLRASAVIRKNSARLQNQRDTVKLRNIVRVADHSPTDRSGYRVLGERARYLQSEYDSARPLVSR